MIDLLCAPATSRAVDVAGWALDKVAERAEKLAGTCRWLATATRCVP